MSQSKQIRRGKRIVLVAIAAVALLILLRLAFFFFGSDGISGLSLLFPLLLIGIFVFSLLMSVLFAAWVYHDCKMRGDDGVLWAAVVCFTTPFIGLLLYFLRRSELKRNCAACNHPVTFHAKFCEECGTKIETTEEMTTMEAQRTHHMKYIVMGTVCMLLMFASLTGFIVNAASGKGINTDITASEKVWNTGVIHMSFNSYLGGAWKFSFKSASEGFISQQNMTIHQPDTDVLHADITCETVPDGATLTLYLVQGETSKSFDVTNLSEPLAYPLTDFESGKLHVRLLIDGVEDTTGEINIQ